jgi:hypothetical protein
VAWLLRAIVACSIPVATTETRIRPSSASSKVAPTMMLASWSTSSRMRVAASSTSNSVRSLPPVMEMRRPLAPFSGGQRALVAGGLARPHHRLAHFAHDGADVGEVEVDQAFLDHQVGDAGDARVEHLVGHREGVGEGGLLVGDPEQVLVRDDQQRIDHLVQLGDAGLGGAHAAAALEMERLGHDADGEDAHVARGLGDDGSSTGAGAAAHAGGDEHHVGAREMVAQLVDHLFGRRGADVRLRAGAEALRDRRAHLHDALRLRHRQRLRVGVGDHEVDALEARRDHVVDGVATGATDAEHGDPGLQFVNIRNIDADGHVCLSITRAWVRPGRRPRELVKCEGCGTGSSEALA